MEEAGLDALVATSPENVYYSSGSARMVSRGMVIEAYDAVVKTVARAGYEFNLPFVGQPGDSPPRETFRWSFPWGLEVRAGHVLPDRAPSHV